MSEYRPPDWREVVDLGFRHESEMRNQKFEEHALAIRLAAESVEYRFGANHKEHDAIVARLSDLERFVSSIKGSIWMIGFVITNINLLVVLVPLLIAFLSKK